MTPQQTAVSNILAQFPDAPSKTLARMLYRSNKALFMNEEGARSAIRIARGAHGVKRRPNADPIHKREPQAPGDPFGKLPEGLTHFDQKWGALEIAGPLRVLILSDLHLPYHDRTALLAALKRGKDDAVDLILLNGDAADFFACSFWEKDPSKRDFAREVETVREFLKALREAFAKARIIYKLGNHEQRYDRFMRVKAPELLGLAEFKLESLFRLKELGIELVSDNRPIRLGNLNALHGHEYKFAISNPVNPARGLFLRAKAHAICGHLHQSSYHSEKNVEQETIATWSAGCLCDLHPDYSPLNNWNHGFAFAEVYSDGRFTVKNWFISNGVVY